MNEPTAIFAGDGDRGFTPLASKDVTPATLAKWRGAVSEAVTGIGRVRLTLAHAEATRRGISGHAGMNTPEGSALIGYQESLRGVWRDLEAVAPSPRPASTTAASSDTLDLFALNTPDTRELLALLDAALAVAEKIDAARGRVLPANIPTSASESRGTDLAEILAEVASRVRSEVHGATGKGLE